ncbi:hypothetical protein FQN54_000921 [Arachnomyces sp. PD_36]|nr:hypothetical protein FQN54_000921 [Arachnomyces sp. PD_36]
MSRQAEAEAAVVQAFNNLPRHEKSPSGLPNHWYFSIRHVELDPPGDLVHLVQPNSHYIHCAGPTNILGLPSPAAKADVIVPLLLDSFIQGINIDPNGAPDPNMPAFAPWTWATKDPELAKAIEKKLKEVGVKGEELCTVQLGDKEQEGVSDVTWAGFMRSLKNKLNLGEGSEDPAEQEPNSTTSCATCKKERSSLAAPLKKCSRCGGPRYCSLECQKAHWKLHKKVCKAAKTGPSTNNEDMDSFNYYNKVAHGVQKAQDLARALNLTLPSGENITEGIAKPIRRLVITGEDTPENLETLLGPKWRTAQASTHEEIRLHVLLDPPRGSSCYALYSGFDKDAPSVSPRPASDEEKQKLQRVRDMQAAIRSRLGSRKEPTMQDMQAIIAGMGQDWTSSLPIYQVAINTMDRGINVP